MCTEFYIWLVLTALLGSAILGICLYRHSHRVPLSQRSDNKLGKAMVNMERACVFEDYPNFFEFSKYAVREAMGLPRGQAGIDITVDQIIDHLHEKQASQNIIDVVQEIYQISQNIEDDEEFKGDLKEKLEKYHAVIREIKNIFGKN